MSDVKTQLSKFVAEVVARISGDTDTATALKNERLAKAALKGQLSALEGALVEAEVNVDNAKEKLQNAIYPTALIQNQGGYYKNIVGTQESLNDAEAALEGVQKSIEYVKTLLKEKF